MGEPKIKNCGSCKRRYYHRKRNKFPCVKCVRNTNPITMRIMPITRKDKVEVSEDLVKRSQLWQIRNERADWKDYWEKG